MSTAQYTVDIAAQMPAGAKTAAQLDDVAAKLTAAGLNAEHMSDAVALASNALGVAEGKAREAAGALAEGNKEFVLLERAALQAAKAEEKAAKLGVVPPDVAASMAAATAALGAHTDKLRGLEQAATKAASEEKHLAGILSNTKQASAAGISALKDKAAAEAKAAAVAETAGKKAEAGARALVPLAGKWQHLGEAMGSTQGQAVIAAGAFSAVVVALVAVTAALVAATVAIAAWAIGLADTNRAAGLTSEAIAAIDPQLGGLAASFATLTDETGLGAEKLRALTKDLRDAKVGAAALPAALEAAALAEAGLGEGGSKDFVAQIKAGKLAVGDFASDMRSKLGGVVAKQMLGLDAQTAKLKRNIGSLFGGLNIEPVLGGLKTLVDLFDQNTAAGSAMQLLFEKVFQPLIDQAQNAAYVIEAFVLGFLIGMTKLYIALKPAIKAVSEFFGFKDTSLADVLAVATKAGEYAAYIFVGFVAALAAVGLVIGGVIAAVIGIQVAIYAMVAAVVVAAVAVGGAFIDAFNAVWDFLTSLPARMVAAGGDMMQGLADGITGAAGAVIGAITGAVGGAVDSAKKLLGIASPSKVFAAIGENTGEGFAQGVDATAPDAQTSMADMVAPPAPAPSATTTNTDNSSRGPLIININGADADVKKQVLDLLESWAGQGGGAPVPA